MHMWTRDSGRTPIEAVMFEVHLVLPSPLLLCLLLQPSTVLCKSCPLLNDGSLLRSQGSRDWVHSLQRPLLSTSCTSRVTACRAQIFESISASPSPALGA